ncbi:MAG: rhodanese-like domain-containing protein [Rhodospirillales bacterium]|nr:rhodanese-like domain-containing protein [Rhodospirillales bacterium]
MSEGAYAGDILPREAWKILETDPASVLIDVRTNAEWAYVGFADLSQLGKQPLFVPWQLFPKMDINPEFSAQMAGVGIDIGSHREAPLLFLCRSGVRSKNAAIAMTAEGFARCYNIAHGFEGDPDGAKHRGRVNGWKVDGLAWVQG